MEIDKRNLIQSMETINTIPSPILQSFSRSLLATPCPSFKDDSKRLWKAYEYIKDRVEKKLSAKTHPRQYREAKNNLQEFLELYERIKEKEKEREGQRDHCTQGFMYSIPCIDRKGEAIFAGAIFRSKARYYSFQHRKHHAVYAKQHKGRIRKRLVHAS